MKKETFRAREHQKLMLENQRLTDKIKGLRSGEQAELRNTLSTLVQAAQRQSNLTSFNPIIQNNIMAPLTINWMALTYMYKTHGLLQTAIEVPVLDGLRDGLDITSKEMDEDDIKEVEDYIEEFGVYETMTESMIWARLFGGAAIIINVDQKPELPLNEAKIKKLELYSCNRWELYAPHILKEGNNVNPWDIQYAASRSTDHYIFYGIKIHKSRVITLTGKTAPHIIRWQLQGWGMSEVERMVEDFNMYLKTNNVLYELLNEAKMDVFRFKNFNAQLVSDQGTQQVLNRIAAMNQAKAFNNALAMDMEDEYEQKQITFSGIAEVMLQNRIAIAAAVRMPITKLFGQSATGFNSGEDDIENYNAMVQSEVRSKLRRPLRKVLNLITLFKFGQEMDLSFEFKPLRIIGAQEEENIKTSKQNRILSIYDKALADSAETGKALQAEKLIAADTALAMGILDPHPLTPEQEMTKENPKGGDGNE